MAVNCCHGTVEPLSTSHKSQFCDDLELNAISNQPYIIMTNYIDSCGARHAALFILICLFAVPQVSAQTAHYKSETRFKVHSLGAMGKMMGNDKPSTNEQYISATHMLSIDSKRTSSIFSIPDEKIISIDHKKKAYYEMSFDDFTSYFESIKADTQGKMDDAGVESSELKFSVKVEDMGESAVIADYKADKKLVIMEIGFSADAVGDDGEMHRAEGNMYTVSEVWVSKDVPGASVMNEFSQNYAEKVGEAFSRNNAGFGMMQQMFMTDGRMGPAMEQLAEEMKKLEGMPLRTISYIVMTPEGQELDVEAVLGQKQEESKKKKKRGGLGRFAKNALKSQGLNVGGSDPEPAEMEAVSSQTVIAETEVVYTMLEIVPDDPGRFTVPSKYKKRDAPSYGNN